MKGEEITKRYAANAPRRIRGVRVKDQMPHPLWGPPPRTAEQRAKAEASWNSLKAEVSNAAARRDAPGRFTRRGEGMECGACRWFRTPGCHLGAKEAQRSACTSFKAGNSK